MPYLLLYDISNNQLRTKTAQKLITNGYERIQLSVFCGLKHPKENRPLWTQLTTLLAAEKTAKFYILKIPKSNFKKMSSIGEIELDIPYLLGDKNTLFI